MFGGALGDGLYGREAVAVDEVCIINISIDIGTAHWEGHTVDDICPLHFIRDQFGRFHIAQHRPDIGIHACELLCLVFAAN